MPYPKRIIEVDLPIKRISAHARREKSIRHGHISTLHIWWARRPLAACRAVLCASLWPDPADENCPSEFIEFAKNEMIKWSDNEYLPLLSNESITNFLKVNNDRKTVDNKIFLRQLLLDFIADFSNWDNSNNAHFLSTSRALTQSAHIALGGEIGTNPMVVDPFAGGGSIPLEALRVGADVFASDLNAIPVLLNKVQLEYIPKYGQKLADEVRKCGLSIKEAAEKELKHFYPAIGKPTLELYTPKLDENINFNGKQWKFNSILKETPLAYLWARTIRCEGPNCGVEVPMMRSLWLAKKGKRIIALTLLPDSKKKKIEIKISEVPSIKVSDAGTVKRGSVVCPCCGFVTPVAAVRSQMKKLRGGANHAMIMAVVSNITTLRISKGSKLEFNETRRYYRLGTIKDLDAFKNANLELQKRKKAHSGYHSLVPEEQTPLGGGSGAGRAFSQRNYGMELFEDLFSSRHLLCLTTLIKHLQSLPAYKDRSFDIAVRTMLALAIDRQADYLSSLTVWANNGEFIAHTFGRQAIPMIWDFPECQIFEKFSGNWEGAFEWVALVIEKLTCEFNNTGTSQISDATHHPLADDSVACFFTDPPYYDAVPYADLSDYFYVWLKRSIGDIHPALFHNDLTNKTDECIVDEIKGKERQYFEKTMGQAMNEGRRILLPNGIGIVVFAHKTTSGWEAQLQSMLDAGWIFTGSWPIDTERPGRLRSQNSAALASSVHLVCRPRENADGSLIQNQIGDWRDVQEELPKRIHEWMPRLAAEGVVGADAIFACLGPALEVFSRYAKVVQAGSEREIPLREYLEKVWAAVSQEALNMVFSGGEAQSLEEDARLTAMWLWTLTAGINDNGNNDGDDEDDEAGDESSAGSGKISGYTLEYDTARKIAQGLGANLEDLKTLIEVKGDKARLLPVQERINKLFGVAGIQEQPIKKKKKVQLSLEFENVEPEDEAIYQMPELKVEQTGKTVLDRLHQAMLLFSTGRTEALKRFLVENGAGKDDRFWKLAQSLTALYPKDTDERRWVEAVQTYKKSLGF